MRTIILACAVLALTACGAAKATRDTAQIFDKYGCMARDFKGDPPCEAE
jgi:hypothetical protein